MYIIGAVICFGIGFFGGTVATVEGDTTPGIFAVIFFLGGIGCLFGVFRSFRNLKLIRGIIKNGTEGVGYFEGSRNTVTVNDKPYFRVEFSYTDEAGVPHIVKSIRLFSRYECEGLSQKGTFKIKHYNGRAVIMGGQFGTSRAAQVKAQETSEKCYYCGRKFSHDQTQCAGCGAGRQ